MIGTQLLHYAIEAPLGAGGMGEVYRARDTRLGRSVAIKVLPELVALDPDRVARFEREARLLASLNHPNIAALHGFESLETRRFLVMELVEGDTLAERITHGPVAVDEALGYARQIADALEAAHEKGVIHRDLKPANVKVTPDSKVKVLDFGLAKAFEGEAPATNVSNSPTLSVAATYAGVILGTAAYMAPEQAKGKAVDKRADIWSFGCVLFELLAGRPPFGGETVSETLADVIKSDPPWDTLPTDLPPHVTTVLRRCLEKDPSRRVRDIGDVRLALEGAFDAPRDTTQTDSPAPRSAPFWRRAVPFGTTALAAAGIVGAVAWAVRPSPATSVSRFSIALPDGQVLTRTGRHNITVSPDGQGIVYVANNQLFLRAMDDLEPRPIEGTDQDINTPFFSPDGQWIGFYAVQEAKLKKIAITGGVSVTIADVANPFGATWEADDQIVIGQGAQGIVRVSANGGKPETIVKVESSEMAHGPQMLPDGEHMLFTVTKAMGPTRWDQAQIVVQSLRTGARTVLINGGSDARYVPTGHIVYTVGTNLLAIPFDHRSVTVTSGPVPILEGVGRSVPDLTAATFFGFSRSGTLAYFTGNVGFASPANWVLVDRNGARSKLPMPPPQGYFDPRISPDGKQVAVTVPAESEGNIWIYDLAESLTPRRLTFGGSNSSPAWTPDGRRVLFISTREGNRNAVFWQPVDGSGSAERLTDPKTDQPMQLRPSADGRTIIYRDARGDDIWMLPLNGDRKPQPVIAGPGIQHEASLSPDARWVVYTSNEAGRSQVYVQPFPPTGAKYLVTRSDAHDPLWSPNGRQIYYLEDGPGNDHRLMSIDVRTESGFDTANPTRLFEPLLDFGGVWAYDIAPDGRQFVVLVPPDIAGPGTGGPEIRVTLNWFEELRQRVPR